MNLHTTAARPRKPAAVRLAAVSFELMAAFWIIAAAYQWATEDTHTLLTAANGVVRAFMLANALILLALAGCGRGAKRSGGWRWPTWARTSC